VRGEKRASQLVLLRCCHNVYVRVLHGNTVAGKNLDPWSVPARVCAHEGEVVGGPVHSRGYFAVFVGLPSVYCMRSFTLSTLSLSLSLISLYLSLTPTLHLPSATPFYIYQYYYHYCSENILLSEIIQK